MIIPLILVGNFDEVMFLTWPFGEFFEGLQIKFNACAPVVLVIQIARFTANTRWEPFHRI